MLRIAGFFVLSLLVAWQPAEAAEKFVTIGTADELGVYYPTGGAICRLVKRGIKDHGIRCFVESTDGSIDNLQGIKNRELDLGIAQTDWVQHAYKGTENFEKIGPDTKLRSLFSLHTEPFTVLVRADSGIKKFRDLEGKRINIGKPGSGVRATLERVMKLESWTRNSFKEVLELKAADQGKALCTNQVDAVVYTAGHPNGAINEVTTSCPTRLVSVEGPEIDMLVKNSPYYFYATIPAGMYRGSTTDIKTFGAKALLVTSADVDEEVVYQVVKAVFGNLDNFKTLHPVFSTLQQKQMVSMGLTVPLHPGALRYYKEHGLLQ